MKTQVILLGDSIRLGYQAAVADELAGGCEVWGPGPNGGTTTNTLAHLDEWVLDRLQGVSAGGAVVHINCGLHDIARRDPETKEPREQAAVSLEQYKQNVERILATLAAQPALGPGRVIWALTTPRYPARERAGQAYERPVADVENYNRVARSVATRLGVRVNDLHAVVMRHGPDKMLTDDGVHYTEAGYVVLGQAVAEAVRAVAGVGKA